MTVQVPSFVGMTLGAANALAASLGHTLVQGDDPYYVASPFDTILSQDQPAQIANFPLIIRVRIAKAGRGSSIPASYVADNGNFSSADDNIAADSGVFVA